MSDGLEILIGTVVALGVAGLTWIVLSQLTRMKKHKIAWITVADSTFVGILFVKNATGGTNFGSSIIGLILVIVVSSLVSKQVKLAEEKRSKNKGESN